MGAMAHVGGGLCQVRRRVEEGIEYLVEGVPLLETTTLLEVVLEIIQEFSQSHVLTLLLD